MRKLGKRQLQILQIMATENTELNTKTTIHTLSGLTYSSFFSGHIGDEVNRILTYDRLRGLINRGLIENITEEGWRWRGNEYKITEEGLALVEEGSK